MSALEKFTIRPAPTRHLLHAIPPVSAAASAAPEPLSALIRLGSRLIPGAVFILRAGDSHDLRMWPAGMMGRRGPLEPLARLLMDGDVAAGEQWIESIGEQEALRSTPAVRDAGPLGFACVPVPGRGRAAVAVLREEGTWDEEVRDTVRDLAMAIGRQADGETRVAPSGPGTDSSGSAEVAARGGNRARTQPITSVAPLLSGVCHQLNNPLTSIQSFAELLLLDARSDDDREALEIVQREAHRAARIVGDLRLVARLSVETSMLKEVLDLNELVRGVVSAREADLREQEIDLAVELEPALPPLPGARAHLEQLISRLLSAAAQSLEGRLEGPRRIEIGTDAVDCGVRLTVRDTGRGLAAEHFGDRLSADRHERAGVDGFDLGLCLVQSIVTSHGGSVVAREQFDHGCVVTVELPTADDALDLLGGDDPPASEPLRLLVVDDEAPIRFSLARYMERRGHTVDQAEDGAAALRMVDAAAGDLRYDIVIADLRMPAIGGERLLECLKSRGDDLDQRLILMTGDAQGPGVSPHLHAAGVPILLKPFELAEVAQVIEAQARLLIG